MTSKTPEQSNRIDEIFTREPEQFVGAYVGYLRHILGRLDAVEIGRFIATLLEARERGATVFFIGNGGSAATASHFANDLAVGTGEYEKPFRAISLTDNVPLMTAIANDFGYEEVFVRQLAVLGRTGDVLVGISASGNSSNVIQAFARARSMGIGTVAITAFDGGKLKGVADQCVHVPTGPREYGPAEDVHMVVDHLVAAYLTRFLRPLR